MIKTLEELTKIIDRIHDVLMDNKLDFNECFYVLTTLQSVMISELAVDTLKAILEEERTKYTV